MYNYIVQNLIDELIKQGYLKTPRIIEAFHIVSREDFLPEELKGEAGINAPLPVGHGQTISQPLTVAFILELLQPEPGNKVLDVGSGSGWQTALLAHIVGDQGKVYAVERIQDLKEFGRKNVAQYGFTNVRFFQADGTRGLKKYAPFDRIIVAAAAHSIPAALIEQLELPGRLVIPEGVTLSDMVLICKDKWGEVSEERYPGFSFVPLLKGLE